MSALPAHVRRDLDRAADGEGRAPTTAHPDCTCVVEVPNVGGTMTRVVSPEARADCSQHGRQR